MRIASAVEEWVGGHFQSSAYVTEGGPFRPEIVVWTCDGLVLAGGAAHPDEVASEFSTQLRRAIERPLVGAPRRPTAVRIADASLAPAVREVLGDEVPIRVAPTPEVDAVAGEMREGIAGPASDASYLADGRVDAAAVGRWFHAMAALYRAAPWRVVPDDSVAVALDAPSLGLRGAVAVFMGGAGLERGVLLFDSAEAHRAFRAFCEGVDMTSPPPAALDVGASLFAMGFERPDELSATMRAEVKRHSWELAGPAAWPRLRLVERDGVLRPVTAADLAKAHAVADALARFVVEHAARLRRRKGPAASERYTIGGLANRPEVVVRVPPPSVPAAPKKRRDPPRGGAAPLASRLVDPAIEALATELAKLLDGGGDVAAVEGTLLAWSRDVLAGRGTLPAALREALSAELARRPVASRWEGPPRLYTLLVTLVDGPITERFMRANPVVSRTIEMRGDQSLAELHGAIFRAFDRDDPHLWEFRLGPPLRKSQRISRWKGPSYGCGDDDDVAEVTLEGLELQKGRRFAYWFDFGDDWWHEIKVVAVADKVPRGRFPRVSARVGKSPPQYADPEEL